MWISIITLLLFFFNQVLAFVVMLIADLMSGNLDGGCSLNALENALTDIDAARYGTSLLLTSSLFVGVLLATPLTGKGVLTAFRKGMPEGWGWGLAGFILVGLGLNGVLSPFGIEDAGVTALFDGMKDNFWCAVLIVLVGPLAEELVFRDGVLRGLCPSGRWMAIVVSAFAFGVIHGNLMQSLPASVLGLLLALLYLRTGDLRLCFPAHVCNNAIGYAGLRWPALEQYCCQLPTAVSVTVGTVMLICGAWMLRRLLKMPKSCDESAVF